MKPALFLDRDGVINVDHGYVHKPEDCQFVDGIFTLVRGANQKGWSVIVVTNQAGIARGYYDEHQFSEFSAWMKAQFIANDAQIDAIYYCPHHPQHGIAPYQMTCDCRKPAPGMLLEAEQAYDIDMEHSVLIGDNLTDLQAGFAAGVSRLYLLQPNSSSNTGNPPVHRSSDCRGFDYWVISHHSQIML